MTQYIDLATVSDERFDSALEEMFLTEGWQFLKSELYANSVQINDLQMVTDQRDLDFRRGQLSIIGYLLNLEDTRDLVAKEKEPDESTE